jgi:hypothetical protein
MSLEQTIKERLESVRATITRQREEIREYELEIETLERVLRLEKSPRRLKVTKKKAGKKVKKKRLPAPPQLVPAIPGTGHPMSLKAVFQLNRTSYLSFEKIINAYQMVIEGREGLTYPELTEAINATIPDKEKHLVVQRVHGKITHATKSPYSEISELFSLTGTRPNTLVHLNLEAVARFQKAS